MASGVLLPLCNAAAPRHLLLRCCCGLVRLVARWARVYIRGLVDRLILSVCFRNGTVVPFHKALCWVPNVDSCVHSLCT